MRFEAPRRSWNPALLAVLLSLACSKNEPPQTASDAARASHGRDIRGATDMALARVDSLRPFRSEPDAQHRDVTMSE